MDLMWFVDGKFWNKIFPSLSNIQEVPHGLCAQLLFYLIDHLFSDFYLRLSVAKGHFPKLTDCAHFHYDIVDFGSIEVSFNSRYESISIASQSVRTLVSQLSLALSDMRSVWWFCGLQLNYFHLCPWACAACEAACELNWYTVDSRIDHFYLFLCFLWRLQVEYTECSFRTYSLTSCDKFLHTCKAFI